MDSTSAFQTMVSRPIVAATVTGLILGRPAEALVLGIILEIFALVILPIGAARHPESGIGAVVAAFIYTDLAGPPLAPALLLLAVVFSLAWERVAGGSVTLLRRANERIVADAAARGTLGPMRLERLHLGAIALDGLRAVVLVFVGIWLGRWLLAMLESHWWPDGDTTLRVLGVAVATVLGAALTLFGGWSTRRWTFLLGILCGLLLLLPR
jgi:PTS system mannose-specific IIC component